LASAAKPKSRLIGCSLCWVKSQTHKTLSESQSHIWFEWKKRETRVLWLSKMMKTSSLCNLWIHFITIYPSLILYPPHFDRYFYFHSMPYSHSLFIILHKCFSYKWLLLCRIGHFCIKTLN
jgi:hypothetical protein